MFHDHGEESVRLSPGGTKTFFWVQTTGWPTLTKPTAPAKLVPSVASFRCMDCGRHTTLPLGVELARQDRKTATLAVWLRSYEA